MLDHAKDQLARTAWNIGVMNLAIVVKVLRVMDRCNDRKLARRYARGSGAQLTREVIDVTPLREVA